MLSVRELNTDEHAEPLLGQRTADLYARLRADAGARQPGDHRGTAGPLHSRPATGLDGRTCASTSRASTLASCRATTRSSRRSRRSFTTRRADDNEATTYDGIGRRVDRRVPGGGCSSRSGSPTPTSCSRTSSRRKAASCSTGGSPIACGLLAPFLSFDADPYPVLSDGRLFWIQDAYTTEPQLPVLHAHDVPGRRDQLHPQFGEDRHRRVSRLDDVLPGRAGRPARADDREDLPRHAAAALRHAGGPAEPRAVSGGHLQDPDGDVPDLPHDHSATVFCINEDQWQVPVLEGDGRTGADAAVLHGHAAAGRAEDRVHPDAAVHAAAQGEPGRLDGRAQRRRPLRQAARVPVPETDRSSSGPSRSSARSTRTR